MRRFLPFEQVVRAVGQVQQLDAFLNVGLVGGLVRRDVAKQAILPGAPLGRLAAASSGVLGPPKEMVSAITVHEAMFSAT